MYGQRLYSPDRSLEYVSESADDVLLWNSGCAPGDQYSPYHEQYAVSGGGAEIRIFRTESHGNHGRGISENAHEGGTAVRDRLQFGDGGAVLAGAEGTVLLYGVCVSVPASADGNSRRLCDRHGAGEPDPLHGGNGAFREELAEEVDFGADIGDLAICG